MDVQISVILSVRNGSRYVFQAVKSILCQTFQNFELIIIDDGSTDDTYNIISQFVYDPRVKLISQDNLGLTLSLIKGIAISRGQYIARQDADDISMPNRLAIQFEFLKSHPEYGLVGSFADILDDNDNFINTIELPVDDYQIKDLLYVNNCFFHGSILMRKAIYNSVGGYRPEFLLAQDYDLWLRISENSLIKNIPQVLYHYRLNSNGISNRMKHQQQSYIRLAQTLAEERRQTGQDMIMRDEKNFIKNVLDLG